MKYRAIKKQLTVAEALEKTEIAKCQIEVNLEFINTVQTTEPTGIISIVMLQEFGSKENAIKKTCLKIEWLKQRIEDLKRFL